MAGNRVIRKNLSGGMGAVSIFAGFLLVMSLSYWAGMRQAQQSAGAPQKMYTLELKPFGRPLDLHLTTGQLGLGVIFILVLLLCLAIVFALIAERQRRQMEAVNRQVREEIAERKSAQEEVNRLNADLERKVEARTRDLQAVNNELEAFCLSVSHDLRAPLRAVDGFSAVLLKEYRDKLGDEGGRYLERVRAGVQRMARLIDDLLSLSRVARAEMRHESVDLTGAAWEVLAELRQLDPERNVQADIAPGLCAPGDPRLLWQVLENLLGNAWKYSSNQPAARIEMGMCQGRNGKKAFFVRDNGAGFDMRYANKLFGIFQRLHSNAEFPGTGVGLATVQRIIQRHGGEVWAEGSVGKGATFYFTL